jgi:glutathione S-transferase
MKLYTLPGACSLASHIALEWIGAPYEAVKVERDRLKSPEFLDLNPAGQVPVLVEDDGWVLTENIAILHYLAELHPQLRLDGDGTLRGRAEVNRWLGFLNSEVHKGFAPIFGPGAFVADTSQHAELQDNARRKLHNLFARIDEALEDRDWLAGAQRSIADPYLFVVLRWAYAKQVDMTGMDNLARFFERMKADAGVQKAMQAEGV